MSFVQSLFGGAKPPLKPSGPAPFAQPDEGDRRALFWWLKRNTSYTAIDHNAKLWSAFAIEWEKWLRSQDNPYEHLIETYKYILDDQINYEKGLERLRRGDRGVWRRRSSDGWLDKINTGLVGRRMEWDHEIELIAKQDGVPLSMVRAYYKAHDSAMAVGHGISYYSLDNSPRSTARSLLASLPFDTSLPEPHWSVRFNPGARCPRDGIYEQVDADGYIVGGMAYFVKGQPSENDDNLEFGPQTWKVTRQRSVAFSWRLLWEDTRYRDCTIPEEEGFYPTPEQSLAAIQANPETSTAARPNVPAGQPCPEAGWWFTPAKPDSHRHFKQGETMPSVGGDYGQTFWQWSPDQSQPEV